MIVSRLLLVDGSESTSRAISTGLRERGYEVEIASDSTVGLRAAVKLCPSVILLNVEIPGLDVSTFIRTLRTRHETALIPVVFLGPRKETEGMIQGFQLGSDDFLSLSTSLRELELHVAVAIKIRDKMESVLRPKGIEAMDFSSPSLTAAFRGTLNQVGLPTLFSLIDMERKTGMLVLILEPDKDKARIYFMDGRAVRAAYDTKPSPKNSELIYELLSHPEGRFEFRNVRFDPCDEINTPTARLLLEGARLIDESRRAHG
jgi:CheY-like chemotaxis protein